jgi:hypothetical protein
MPDLNPKIEPNPTRLPDAVLPEPSKPDRLADNPEFAPGFVPSEKAAVQAYTRQELKTETTPKAPPVVDKRLRTYGTLILAGWFGALFIAAVIRMRHHHS